MSPWILVVVTASLHGGMNLTVLPDRFLSSKVCIRAAKAFFRDDAYGMQRPTCISAISGDFIKVYPGTPEDAWQ